MVPHNENTAIIVIARSAEKTLELSHGLNGKNFVNNTNKAEIYN